MSVNIEPSTTLGAPGLESETWDTTEAASPSIEIDRQTMEVDIACAGFGPAMGGFLTTLTRTLSENPTDPAFESKVMPGMPLQVLCYERADARASHSLKFPRLEPGRDSHGGRCQAGTGAVSA
jgi:hypothetical protein